MAKRTNRREYFLRLSIILQILIFIIAVKACNTLTNKVINEGTIMERMSFTNHTYNKYRMRITSGLAAMLLLGLIINGCGDSTATLHSSDTEPSLSKKMSQRNIHFAEDLPQEILDMYKQRDEALKQLLGVEELPWTEIAPGTFVRVPQSYRKGEKAKQIAAFYGKWNTRIFDLYKKHGLYIDEMTTISEPSGDTTSSPKISAVPFSGTSYATSAIVGPIFEYSLGAQTSYGNANADLLVVDSRIKLDNFSVVDFLYKEEPDTSKVTVAASYHDTLPVPARKCYEIISFHYGHVYDDGLTYYETESNAEACSPSPI